ncbi:MAG: tetratricopeptide repeat protein [Planctomycetota bacterium]
MNPTTASAPAPGQATRLFCLLFALALGVSPMLLTGCASIGSAKRERAQTYLDDAQRLLDEGLDDAALATLGLAVQENPKLTAAYLQIASIHKDRGDYLLAQEQYDTAVQVDPENFDAIYGGALVRQLGGKLSDAVRQYLKALTVDPQSFLANRDLSSAYLQLGEPRQALPYAIRSTRLDPDDQPAWSNLAVSYAMLGQWEGAINAYRMAAELGELDDLVLLGLADAHIRLGNFGRAINTLDTLLRRSGSGVAHERMGYANFKLRRFEQALRHYDAAIGFDETDVAALNGKGVSHITLFIEGRYENPFHKVKGVEAWRKSLALNPNQPRIVDLLSRYGAK